MNGFANVSKQLSESRGDGSVPGENVKQRPLRSVVFGDSELAVALENQLCPLYSQFQLEIRPFGLGDDFGVHMKFSSSVWLYIVWIAILIFKL